MMRMGNALESIFTFSSLMNMIRVRVERKFCFFFVLLFLCPENIFIETTNGVCPRIITSHITHSRLNRTIYYNIISTYSHYMLEKCHVPASLGYFESIYVHGLTWNDLNVRCILNLKLEIWWCIQSGFVWKKWGEKLKR